MLDMTVQGLDRLQEDFPKSNPFPYFLRSYLGVEAGQYQVGVAGQCSPRPEDH